MNWEEKEKNAEILFKCEKIKNYLFGRGKGIVFIFSPHKLPDLYRIIDGDLILRTVRIDEIKRIENLTELKHDVKHSGFENLSEWNNELKILYSEIPESGCLYAVKLMEVKTSSGF